MNRTQSAQAKKPWTQPALFAYGSVEELTGGKKEGVGDFLGDINNEAICIPGQASGCVPFYDPR